MHTTHHVFRLGAALLAPLLGVAIAVAAPVMASAATPGACTDEEGVAVVVDFTDVGGDIVTRCAPADPASGREALDAAGFTLTESQPGLICAIDSRPDPCPETFDGSYWSYWHSTRNGDWTSYLVGADSSDPVPGELEGWRYNDGSTGPGLAPAEAAASLLTPTSTPTPTPTPMPTTSAVDGTGSAPTATPGNDAVLFAGLGIGALVILAAILAVVASRRRRTPGAQ